MKSSLKIVLLGVVMCVMLLTTKQVTAQCAQCAATVETNAKSGDNITKGLNKGILFLLAAPYMAVAIGGYVWYRNYRKKDVSINIANDKLHLN